MTRRVLFVAFEGVQTLDVVGPLEVFSTANRLGGDSPPRYRIQVAGLRTGTVRSSSGVALGVDVALRQVRGPIDTVLVAGGPGSRAAAGDAALLRGLRRVTDRALRVASVCTGAFVLGALGLLDGRRVTTHWAYASELAQRFPQAQVEPDRIFCCAHGVWTSAGITAGMDLALELVAQDHGARAAAEVARWMVLYMQRPGGQTQFSTPLQAQPHSTLLRELQVFMVSNPAADLSIHGLARRVAMSPRTFQRAFQRECGVPAGAYVERLRVEAARNALESTDASVAQVAQACGFGAVETMYRAFQRQLHVPPATYRRHFRLRQQDHQRPNGAAAALH